MINDRPIDDPKLQRALDQMKAVMGKFGFAGCCMLVGPEEAAFTYHMHAPWSALRYDNSTPLGFRLRAVSAEIGKAEAEKRVEGAVHTICQLSDFGEQTTAWMEDLKLMVRRAGINFDHTPFSGQPLPHLGPQPPDAAPSADTRPRTERAPPELPAAPDALPGSLAKAWLTLERMALAPNTLPVQRQESRRMFYAGAQALLAIVMGGLDPGEEPTDADLDRISALNAELLAFAQAMAEGRA